MTPIQALNYLLHILFVGSNTQIETQTLFKIEKFSQEFKMQLTDNIINVLTYSIFIATAIISIYYLIDIFIMIFKKIKK